MKSPRRYLIRLDRRSIACVAALVIVVELLVGLAGWIAGHSRGASQPARRSVSASAVSPVERPRIVPQRTTMTRPLPRPSVFTFTIPQLAAKPQPQVSSLIARAALQHGVPESLIRAVVRVESDFDIHAVSNKGAMGVMQVIPGTAARFGVRRDELFDPERNIAAGTAYLAWLLERYDGNVDLALAAYNAGEGAVAKYGGIPPYRETQNYVRKVRAHLIALEN